LPSKAQQTAVRPPLASGRDEQKLALRGVGCGVSGPAFGRDPPHPNCFAIRPTPNGERWRRNFGFVRSDFHDKGLRADPVRSPLIFAPCRVRRDHRHCEERSDRSKSSFVRTMGLLRGACSSGAFPCDPLARKDGYLPIFGLIASAVPWMKAWIFTTSASGQLAGEVGHAAIPERAP